MNLLSERQLNWLMIALVLRGFSEPAACPGLQGFLKSRAERGTVFDQGPRGSYIFLQELLQKT